jgi:3-oxoacyl-[acyl-carrier protein] reductase
MSQITLITGSNGGIGLVVAEYLLAQGMRCLAFQYRSASDKIVDCLKRYDLDPEKHLFKADLCSESDVTTLRTSIDSNLGTVWGLVNIAGGSSNSMSWKTSFNDFRKVLDDNLTSTFLSCREFIPGMRSRGSGRIINISSVVASTGISGASHYCAAKGAVTSYTKALSLELAPKNITANTIALGYFQYGLINQVNEQLQAEIRERIPLKRFGSGSEVGGLIKFLLSEESSYTTGQVLHINGGQY